MGGVERETATPARASLGQRDETRDKVDGGAGRTPGVRSNGGIEIDVGEICRGQAGGVALVTRSVG
jgi:hypothetical protein